ncbi:MAG TPA: hypothetical protein VH374_02490 [Polyangia bacterium]|jgi:hypothetical protein|nr:hypothetical protein [Polyangia bacterium]
MKMSQVVFMMGEVSSFGSTRTNRISKVAILRSPKRRRGPVAGFHRRLRSADDVPASGQIVFRAGRSVVL